MRFFASWWERVPTRPVGKALGVATLVVVLGLGFSAPAVQTTLSAFLRPVGEIWG